MEQEIWKCIEGFEKYQISSYGRVKSFKNKNPKILKPGKTISGYYYVNLYKNNIFKPLTVHRLAAKAFIPNPENKLTVNHINGFKNDNNVTNLEWATSSENNQHAWNTGLKEKCRKAVGIMTELNKKPVYSEKLNMKFESIISASIYVKEHYFNNSTVNSISTTINHLIAGRKQTSMYDYGWKYIDKINNMEQ